MNLYLRFFLTFIGSLWRKKLRPMESSILNLHVWPNDLDLNMHLNNGRYLSIMDLGRMDLIFRSGLLSKIIKARWQPLVASVTIRFRKALNPFQGYQLHTRLLCWDEKWFIIEQRFTSKNMVVATALVKVLLRGPQGNIPSQQVLAAIDYHQPSPPMPEEVLHWIEMETKMKTEHP